MFRGRLGYGSISSPSSLLRASPGTPRFFLRWPRHAKPSGEAWWSQTGSNRRPHACKARALPAELWPRNQNTNATGRAQETHALDQVVGLGRLELPTSRLSSARSNQLSYKPQRSPCYRGIEARSRASDLRQTRRTAQPPARVRPRRKRNEDGEIPPMELNDLAIDWPLNVSKTIR